MAPEQARLLLLALRAKNIQPHPVSGAKGTKKLIASCPLASYLHEKGTDENPSFAVVMRPDGRTFFHCYTCESGSLSKLLSRLTFQAGKFGRLAEYDFKTAASLVDGEEVSEIASLDYKEFPATEDEFFEWPQYYLDSFQPFDAYKEAVAYLKYRGLNLATCHSAGLVWDSAKRMVGFPYYNVFGKFAGIRGRAIGKDAKDKHHEYTWNHVRNSRLVWYREHLIDWSEPVVIVEGQIDCLRTAQWYPNVMANLTGKPVASKMGRLKFAKKVVLVPDNDATGHKSLELFQSYCHQNKIPFHSVDLVGLPKDKAYGEGECKDPGDVELAPYLDLLRAAGIDAK